MSAIDVSVDLVCTSIDVLVETDENTIAVVVTKDANAGDYMAKACIGRVLVKAGERKYGYGVDIMNASIKAIKDEFEETSIVLSAQSYLKRFYNSMGFQEKGGEYLEDGIPHVMMVKD